VRAGSVWAMSGTSGEAIAAVVRQVLSVRGPMAEDDLLGVLDADGINRVSPLGWCEFGEAA
jgi:hypothetical protein